MINYERACYSLSALNEAVKRVKKTSWTVRRKNAHFAKWIEINALFEYAAERLNQFLFDPEIELKRYRNMAYNYKAWTNAELNAELRRKRLYICEQLNGIYASIQFDEVDYCD